MSDPLKALIGMQNAVRDMAEAAEQVAQVAKDADESAIAFAAFMLRESLLAYGKAVAEYMKESRG